MLPVWKCCQCQYQFPIGNWQHWNWIFSHWQHSPTPTQKLKPRMRMFRIRFSFLWRRDGGIAPYRIRYRTRGERGCNGKSHLVTFCASRPLTPSPRAGRLFAAWRATGKTEDATRFRRVGIPSRNVRLDQYGMEWNRPRNRCRHLRFFRNFGA